VGYIAFPSVFQPVGMVGYWHEETSQKAALRPQLAGALDFAGCRGPEQQAHCGAQKETETVAH
jgi:hypothetical protein